MKITRHNYEEYFLLYVDNELQPEERVHVESFAQQHPDLAAELEMLQQATLAEDDVVLADKSSLYKTQSGISISNYEEYFVLAVDNELSAAEAADVERFVLQHPALQQQFTLLMQTKLPPEVVVFKEKESLYRNAKNRRVVPVWFLRASVAAALLGVVFTTWMFNSGSNHNPSLTSVKTREKSLNKISVAPQALTVTKSKADALDPKNEKAHKADVAIIPTQTTPKKKMPPLGIEVTPAPVVANNKEDKEMRNASATDETTRLVSKEQQSAASHKSYEPNEPNINDYKNTIAMNDNLQQPSLASHAVYLDTDDNNDEDRSIYIGNAAINKNKLKGLFKKASVLFRKKISTN